MALTKYKGGGSDSAVTCTSACLVVLPFQTFIRKFYILQLSARFILTNLGKVHQHFITVCIQSTPENCNTAIFLLQLAFRHRVVQQNSHHFLIEQNVHISSENAVLKALQVNFYSSNYDYKKRSFHISPIVF